MYLCCFFGIRKLLTHILGTCLDVHVWRERRNTADTYSFEDTKGVMKIRKSKNRKHNCQKTEEQTTQLPKDRRTDNTIAKRQKNRQHNCQKKKDKNTNNDLQNIHIKIKIE